MSKNLKDYPDIKKKVEKIVSKLEENNGITTVYDKKDNKLVKLFSNNSKKSIMKELKEYIDDYEHEEGYEYVLISYSSSKSSFLHGPFAMMCTIIVIGKNNKINPSLSKIGVIDYTINDIDKRGFKVTDYKKLYNKVKKGLLTDNKKVYTAKHLDSV